MSGFIDSLWHGLPRAVNQVYVGLLRHETKPGLYHFDGIGMNGAIAVDDVQLLHPDADLEGTGIQSSPSNPSACVVVGGPGGAFFAIGFTRAPSFDDESDTPPELGHTEANAVAGDKSFTTTGGASLLLKAGGGTVLESGGSASLLLNKLNGQYSLVSSNMAETADGYVAGFGRVTPGATDPETRAVVEYRDQTGPSYMRVRIKHGTMDGNAKREITVSSMTETPASKTGVIKLRETYYDDGSWIGEGSKYQWGGSSADEPAVLGNKLVDAFKSLFSALKQLTVNTAWGPSGPPLPSFTTQLDQIQHELSSKILSTYLFLTKDPASPGSTTE